jgi:hypothetical protein
MWSMRLMKPTRLTKLRPMKNEADKANCGQ